MKRSSFFKLWLKGAGFIVLGNVMCLIATMGLTMFGKNLFTNVLGMIIAVLIFYLLVFTVAWKDGVAERSLVKNGRVDAPLKYRWIMIGIAMFGFAVIPTVVLLLNVLFFPEADTLFFYKFINGSAFPFVSTFIPVPEISDYVWSEAAQTRQIDNMSVLFPALMLVYYAFIPAVTQLGYYMGYNDKLNTDKIMYQ